MEFKTREQFFVQPEKISSAEETDDNFIEKEVEETVLQGHAKLKLAAEETNNEEYTPRDKQKEIPYLVTIEKVGMEHQSSRWQRKVQKFREI